jgi:hypothetical protein
VPFSGVRGKGGVRHRGAEKYQLSRGCLIVETWAMIFETLTLGYTWDSTLGNYTLSV